MEDFNLWYECVFYLLHELYSLPLLLLSQPLPSLSFLETLTERVIIVKFHVLVEKHTISSLHRLYSCKSKTSSLEMCLT